jgi:hypothetical protein
MKARRSFQFSSADCSWIGRFSEHAPLTGQRVHQNAMIAIDTLLLRRRRTRHARMHDGFVTVVSQGPRRIAAFFVFEARLEPTP